MFSCFHVGSYEKNEINYPSAWQGGNTLSLSKTKPPPYPFGRKVLGQRKEDTVLENQQNTINDQHVSIYVPIHAKKRNLLKVAAAK